MKKNMKKWWRISIVACSLCTWSVINAAEKLEFSMKEFDLNSFYRRCSDYNPNEKIVFEKEIRAFPALFMDLHDVAVHLPKCLNENSKNNWLVIINALDAQNRAGGQEKTKGHMWDVSPNFEKDEESALPMCTQPTQIDPRSVVCREGKLILNIQKPTWEICKGINSVPKVVVLSADDFPRNVDLPRIGKVLQENINDFYEQLKRSIEGDAHFFDNMLARSPLNDVHERTYFASRVLAAFQEKAHSRRQVLISQVCYNVVSTIQQIRDAGSLTSGVQQILQELGVGLQVIDSIPTIGMEEVRHVQARPLKQAQASAKLNERITEDVRRVLDNKNAADQMAITQQNIGYKSVADMDRIVRTMFGLASCLNEYTKQFVAMTDSRQTMNVLLNDVGTVCFGKGWRDISRPSGTEALDPDWCRKTLINFGKKGEITNRAVACLWIQTVLGCLSKIDLERSTAHVKMLDANYDKIQAIAAARDKKEQAAVEGNCNERIEEAEKKFREVDHNYNRMFVFLGRLLVLFDQMTKDPDPSLDEVILVRNSQTGVADLGKKIGAKYTFLPPDVRKFMAMAFGAMKLDLPEGTSILTGKTAESVTLKEGEQQLGKYSMLLPMLSTATKHWIGDLFEEYADTQLFVNELRCTPLYMRAATVLYTDNFVDEYTDGLTTKGGVITDLMKQLFEAETYLMKQVRNNNITSDELLFFAAAHKGYTKSVEALTKSLVFVFSTMLGNSQLEFANRQIATAVIRDIGVLSPVGTLKAAYDTFPSEYVIQKEDMAAALAALEATALNTKNIDQTIQERTGNENMKRLADSLNEFVFQGRLAMANLASFAFAGALVASNVREDMAGYEQLKAAKQDLVSEIMQQITQGSVPVAEIGSKLLSDNKIQLSPEDMVKIEFVKKQKQKSAQQVQRHLLEAAVALKKSAALKAAPSSESATSSQVNVQSLSSANSQARRRGRGRKMVADNEAQKAESL